MAGKSAVRMAGPSWRWPGSTAATFPPSATTVPWDPPGLVGSAGEKFTTSHPQASKAPIMATFGFAVIHWFVSDSMIYHRFSGYNAKIMDNLMTRAENRCTSLDLLLHGGIAHLFRLIHPQTPEQLPLMIRRQCHILVYRRRSGNWVGPRLNGPTPRARRSDPRSAAGEVLKGRSLTSVN